VLEQEREKAFTKRQGEVDITDGEEVGQTSVGLKFSQHRPKSKSYSTSCKGSEEEGPETTNHNLNVNLFKKV
jgi:hypothetical protein